MKKKKFILLADDLRADSEEGRKRSQAQSFFASVLGQAMTLPVQMVYVDVDPSFSISKTQHRKYFQALLDQQKKDLELRSKKVEGKVTVKILQGDLVQSILKAARSGAELIVLGTHGRRGLKRVLLGSVAEEILRHSPCPVVTLGPVAQDTARDASREPIGTQTASRIVIGTDLGPNSRKAEAYALLLAKKLKAEVILVHSLFEAFHPVLQTAFASPGAASQLQEVFDEFRRDAEKSLQTKVAQFKKSGVIAQYKIADRATTASQAVLSAAAPSPANAKIMTWIVMGTHSRSALGATFLGSSARQVILESPVPVITVASKK